MAGVPISDPDRVWFEVVLLKHTLPDGTIHFDWMFARDDPPSQRLVTYRTTVRPDLLRSGESALIARIADHRTRYLTYQGPVSGNRGHVDRVRRGLHRPMTPTAPSSVDWDQSVRLRINWAANADADMGASGEKISEVQEWEIRGTTARLVSTGGTHAD